MEDLVKVLAPMLTIFVCLLGLYEKYGVKYTFEIFLFIMIILLLVIKFSNIQKPETKDKSPSPSQSVIIKSRFGYTKTGNISQNMGTDTEIGYKEGRK